jgi:hypothetical protein
MVNPRSERDTKIEIKEGQRPTMAKCVPSILFGQDLASIVKSDSTKGNLSLQPKI